MAQTETTVNCMVVQVEECLSGTDVHMFGDSRMRALSFSVMNALSLEVV
jgi:hypothetical protein